MKTKRLSIRELHAQLAKVPQYIQEGYTIYVLKHKQVMFQISAVVEEEHTTLRKGKEDLLALAQPFEERDQWKEAIDDIVYPL